MEETYVRRIGERLVVIPSWYYDSFGHELALTASDLPIVLNPGDGWGTGSHATTQMCTMLLEKYMKPGDRVLDIGCGSGILSLAAGKFGAGSVLGVDIDPEAERATLENVARNYLEDKIEFRLGSLDTVLQSQPPIAPYPIVLNNTFTHLIIPFLQSGLATLLAHDGKLIHSGILERQAEGVIEALHSVGLQVIEQRETDGWVAMVAGRG
jgi:ribosomal protein L11 methyltransferase